MPSRSWRRSRGRRRTSSAPTCWTAWSTLDAAYSEAFGEHLTINSSYRTYESQELYDPSSPIAAPPGCSNHGLGLAVDIGGGVETFDTVQYDWLKPHAESYDWTHPDFAEPDGRVPEPWHWESVLARAATPLRLVTPHL